MNSEMRIAVSALNAYPAIEPTSGRNVGGLENFAWTFSRALAGVENVSASLLIRHAKPIREDSIAGVELVKMIEPLREARLSAGHCVRRCSSFPYLAVQQWKWPLLWQIPILGAIRILGLRRRHEQQLERLLRTAAPQLVVTLGVNADSVATIQAARQMGLPNALWFRSNGDLDSRFFQDPQYTDPYVVTSTEARYCIEQADQLIAQTQWQADQLRQLTGRECHIIRNPIDISRFPLPSPSLEQRNEVLWIGRMDRHHKRPLLAVEIARRCPDISFVLVANRSDARVEAEVRQTCPQNVRIVDYVPRDEIPGYYRRARLFLSTGTTAYEGFPNVFLESAASGTPIISLEDFDDFLNRSKSGIATQGDLERAAQVLQELWNSTTDWNRHSQAGRAFVEQHHSTSACVQQFLSKVAARI